MILSMFTSMIVVIMPKNIYPCKKKCFNNEYFCKSIYDNGDFVDVYENDQVDVYDNDYVDVYDNDYVDPDDNFDNAWPRGGYNVKKK